MRHNDMSATKTDSKLDAPPNNMEPPKEATQRLMQRLQSCCRGLFLDFGKLNHSLEFHLSLGKSSLPSTSLRLQLFKFLQCVTTQVSA